jgi:menaquinol-cytochrome c reductase iron-sulfur subunit
VAIKDSPNEVSRRTFLAQGIGASIAFLAALIGIPAIGAAVGPALKRTDSSWVELGKASSFPEGVPTSVEFGLSIKDGWIQTTETKAVWVLRDQNKYTVYNGRCTHLGCAYHWDAAKAQFLCPCHGGVFSKEGTVLGGPPPRSLDPMPTRVQGDTLQVQYMNFRLGTPERVAS